MATLPHLPEGKWADLPEDLRTQLLGIYQQGYDGLMEELEKARDEVGNKNFNAASSTQH